MQNITIAKTESNHLQDLKEGTLVEINKIVKKGVTKVLGIVYDFNKNKDTVWVETTEDIYKIPSKEIKVVNNTTQPKKGFNKNKTKLTEQAVRDIYLMATTTNLSHKHIVSWVKLHHNIEIVPKTVSDIKLGKRWKRLKLTEKGA